MTKHQFHTLIRIGLGLTTATCIVLTTACQSKSTEEKRPEIPAPSFRWIDNKELTTSEGTFVRAVAESYFVRQITGEPDSVYPGYQQIATGHYPGADIAMDSSGIRQGIRGTGYEDKRNTQYLEFGLTRSRNGTVFASACHLYTYDTIVFRFQPEGKAPPTGVAGPANRPTTNVFGDWYLTEFDKPTPASQDNPTHCDAPPPKDLPAPGAPALPPSPGWPQ